MKRKDCRTPRGSVYDNNGYWYYDVRLPGEDKRRKHPLCAPGSSVAMRSDRPREMALEAAHRLWESATKQERHAPQGPTVDAICARFISHCETYYQNGSEAKTCAIAVRVLRDMFGSRAMTELVHSDLIAIRDAMIRSDKLCRSTINRYMSVITNRLMPWACDEGLIRPSVKIELSSVVPLKRGRCAAREPLRVASVDDSTIERTMASMMPNTADMVRVHRLTGMRPEEICVLRWSDIDQSVTPWRYTPSKNKNEWRGQPRIVCIGPKARAILMKHRDTEYPFSPTAAVYERMLELRAKATSPSRYSRKDPHAQIKPRDHWDTSSYTKTIAAACRRADIPIWSANKLRHALATEVRRRFGINAASAVLGHSQGHRVTDRYSWEAAEDEMYNQAAPAIEILG